MGYPLRDTQEERPAGFCRRCRGELYRYDPPLWEGGGRLCPVCAAEGTRTEEQEKKHDAD